MSQNGESDYFEIERCRNFPPPSNVTELLEQVADLHHVATEFPDYFPERISDEKLVEIIEKGAAKRRAKRILSLAKKRDQL